jgi:hypothetical protein
MRDLLEARGLTVELPTAAGLVRPVMRAGKFLELGLPNKYFTSRNTATLVNCCPPSRNSRTRELLFL